MQQNAKGEAKRVMQIGGLCAPPEDQSIWYSDS